MYLREAYERAHIRNRERLPNDTQPETLYPEYTLVVNSKPELLACAALWNPFDSEVFAWVDAGAGRKKVFPPGVQPLQFPPCGRSGLCVGRRMWIFWDFRSKVLRLKHGSTFDSTVLLGMRRGVLSYALWFQWAIDRYLSEEVMDDEQGVIAEVWWDGRFPIESFYGMSWDESVAQMLRHDDIDSALGEQSSLALARSMGRWWGRHPSLVLQNTGSIWIPFKSNLMVVELRQVNQISDEELERLAYAMWCIHRQFGYYERFCRSYLHASSQVEIDTRNLPVVSTGNRVVSRSGIQ